VSSRPGASDSSRYSRNTSMAPTSTAMNTAATTATQTSLGDAVDEESRLNHLVNQTTAWSGATAAPYGGASMGRGRGRGGAAAFYGSGPPPIGYICHRCGQGGHYINSCPTNGDPSYDFHRMKKPTGIPKSFLKAVSIGDPNASLMLPGGVLATMAPNEEVFQREVQAKREASQAEDSVPEEYKCLICKKLLVDPQLVTCCGMSFCKSCIFPDEGDLTSCPNCKTVLKPSTIIPNHSLNALIKKYKQEKPVKPVAPLEPAPVQPVATSVPERVVNPPAANLTSESKPQLPTQVMPGSNPLPVVSLPMVLPPGTTKDSTFTVIQPAGVNEAEPIQQSPQPAVCYICSSTEHVASLCPHLPPGWDPNAYVQWLQQYYADPRAASMYYAQRNQVQPQRTRSPDRRRRSRSRSDSRSRSRHRKRSHSRSRSRSRRDDRRSRRSRSRSRERSRRGPSPRRSSRDEDKRDRRRSRSPRGRSPGSKRQKRD
jgi:hypothetical protein